MRLIKAAGLLLALAALPAGAAAQDRGPTPERQAAGPAAGQEQWLFVLHGEVESVSEGRMVLAPEPKIIAFTDRPERQVRIADTGPFIDRAWTEGSSFRQSPPNAAMTREGDDETSIVVLEDVRREGAALAIAYSGLSGEPPAAGEHVVFVIDFNWNNNIP